MWEIPSRLELEESRDLPPDGQDFCPQVVMGVEVRSEGDADELRYAFDEFWEGGGGGDGVGSVIDSTADETNRLCGARHRGWLGLGGFLRSKKVSNDA